MDNGGGEKRTKKNNADIDNNRQQFGAKSQERQEFARHSATLTISMDVIGKKNLNPGRSIAMSPGK
jgi:hypothetical protein